MSDIDATPEGGPPSERRRRGLEMMRRVYGWDVQDGPGDFFEMTADHLFGEVWARDVFTVRDRRLILIGLLVGQGLDDVVELQLEAALEQGDLDASELRELVIFLSHYAGWPRGAKLNSAVETVIGRGSGAPRDGGSRA